MTLTSFRINTYEKPRGRGAAALNLFVTFAIRTEYGSVDGWAIGTPHAVPR